MKLFKSYSLAFLTVLLVLTLTQAQLSTENEIFALMNITYYDKSLLPTTNDTTYVYFRYNLSQFQSINDVQDDYKVIERKWRWWKDPRLAYGNNAKFSNYSRQNYIDITDSRDYFWRPKMDITQITSIKVVDRYTYLYGDGTILDYEYSESIYYCDFDYNNFPNDIQTCNFTTKIQFYNYTEVTLKSAQYLYMPQYWRTGNVSFTDIDLISHSTAYSIHADITSIEEGIEYVELDDTYVSFLVITFKLDRDPYSNSVYFILSSCIFIFMSYCTFWVSKFSVTARTQLAIQCVLITIGINNYLYGYLPPIQTEVWLEKFLKGILIFSCITMLEVVVCNFCTIQFESRRQQMDNIITSLRENLQKVKQKFLKAQQEKLKYQSTMTNALKKLLQKNLSSSPDSKDNSQQNVIVNPFLQILVKKTEQLASEKKEIVVEKKQSQKAANHLFSDGNESDNADRDFNIEEEKTNGSRMESSIIKKNIKPADSSTGKKKSDEKSSTASSKEGEIENPIDNIDEWADEEDSSLDSSGSDDLSDLHDSQSEYSEDAFEDSFEKPKEEDDFEKQLEQEQVKQQEAQQEREQKEAEAYQRELSKHINDLEEAQKDSNPARFKLAFNSFKIFVIDHWTQIDYDLDARTRKQIERVFEIENSFEFKIYYFIQENLDYAFRFLYAAVFILYICLCLSDLYFQQWLYSISIIVFAVSIILWCLAHILIRMKESKLTFNKTLEFYGKFYCIFPREKKSSKKFKNKAKKEK